MKQVDSFLEWFKSHRTVFGSGCASLGAILIGAATLYDYDAIQKLGALVTLIGTHIGATGVAKSDEFYRDRKEVLETKVDRRAPRAGATIPSHDLKKLEDKADLPKPEPPKYQEVPPHNGGD